MAQIAIRRETMLAAIESFFKKVCFARKNFTQTSSNEMKGVTRMDTVKGPALSNREQLSRLIRTYEKDLLRLCCIYMKDVTLAEDAVQETFIKAYKSMDAFRGDSSARTWLIRIAINTCRDMRRGSWLRNRERTVDWERLQVPVETELATNIALTEAILNLAPKYREVVYLHFYEDLNMSEVAALLGVSVSTVTRRRDKAMKLLRSALDDAVEGGVSFA